MNVALHPFHLLPICAGTCGLELGVRVAGEALGWGTRAVAYVERESYAAALIVARMADQALDEAPIWDDVATFDGRPWRGRVHCITAGFPCQPWSLAGKRKGTGDERWIWPDINRVIGEVEPDFVFLENVRGLITGRGLGPVLGNLADLRFNAEWGVFSAAGVGATHQRQRVFILAHRAEQRERRLPVQPSDGWHTAPNSHVGGSIGPMAHSRSRGRQRTQMPLTGTAEPDAAGGGPVVDDARCAKRRPPFGTGDRGREGQGGRQEVSSGVGQPDAVLEIAGGQGWAPDRAGRTDLRPAGANATDAPSPDVEHSPLQRGGEPQHNSFAFPRERAWQEPGGRRDELGDAFGVPQYGRRRETSSQPEIPPGSASRIGLFPPEPGDFDAWRAILAEYPALEPAVCKLADGVSARVDRLRASGNGAVPLVAAVAFYTLFQRLHREG